MANNGDREISRDPLNEVIAAGDIDSIITLGPVQPKGEFNGTYITVSGRLKRLRFQEGWYTGMLFNFNLNYLNAKKLLLNLSACNIMFSVR